MDNIASTEGGYPAAAEASGRATAPLVEGPIWRMLIVFSLPIFAGNVLQSLNVSINAA